MGKEPDFLGLGGYNSSASDASSSEASGSTSDGQSVDSAELRAAEAEARLKDFGPAATSQQKQKPSTGLPSALDAFTEVNGRPAFLDPEATRPLAVSRTHGLAGGAAAGAAAAAGPGQQQKGRKGRLPAEGEEFDIARLAPPLKGQQQQADKRGPPGAVIEGKAKRYKLEEGPEATQQYTPAQIAMMGGNVEHLLEDGNAAAGSSKPNRGPASKPMGVTDFLDKGLGGAQLPRKQQELKEKEKKKRTLGQSTHSHWKSEAEMVLRQQYD